MASGSSQEVVRNKKVILRQYVSSGVPKESDMHVVFSTIRLQIPDNMQGVVLVKNLYLSCDPYMRLRMRDDQDPEFTCFTPGIPLNGFGVCKILDSTYKGFQEGDLAWGTTGWEEYSLITTPERLFKIHHTDVPLTFYAGILGMPGMAACIGLYEISRPKKGDTFFISGASGAVGQLAGQLAKMEGCYVVGCAGSEEKVQLLKNSFGFDAAFNYNIEHNYMEALKRYFPEGIDVYFDNIGGRMLEAVLLNMKPHGRITACGMTSQYNLDEPEGIQNLMCLVFRRIKMQGFIVFDYCHMYLKFSEMLLSYLREGKIVYMEQIVEGLVNGPAALIRTFSGHSVGKQVVQVASD